ncbi:MAG: hypothetical protein KAI64_06085 [Thermoplasmata archaeon]|nr:hypothetical protein [Thermoplasmata archaeon]
MVCYSIVLGAAIVMHGLRNKVRNSVPHTNVLSLLLWGGSIALVIDHLFNGELFLLGGNLAWDLLLGIAMTLGIFIIWALYVAVSRSASRPLRA